MEKLNVINSRNKFIILFFIGSVIMHIISMPFLDIYHEIYIVISALCYSLLLLVCLKKFNYPKVLRFFIIFGCSTYVFSINIATPDTAHLLYLIYPIILTSIYNIMWLNAFVTILTAIQLMILFALSSSSYFAFNQANVLPHAASILLIVIFLCIMFVITFGREWNAVFSENERLDTIVASKSGYLELFFKHANDGIAVFDLEGNILDVNPAFEVMYGWNQHECIRHTPRFYPSSQDKDAEYRRQQVMSGESFHAVRTKELRKDGTIFDAELTIAPIYNDLHELIAISFISRDITDKLQAEKNHLDTEKLKSMGEIAASVAHEVRNPLTSIFGFIQLMQNDLTNPYTSYTDIISCELKRIDLIVGEFLVLSKPSLQITTEFYIEETIQNVIDMFTPSANKSSISINFHQSTERRAVSGNEYALKQVFINLIKNSIEAHSKSGLIRIESDYQNDKIVITISDNGVGMDSETLHNLFEPFYTTKTDGTGLGMMISKKIIVDHKGTISVSSRKKVGTEVVLTLPISV